MKWGPGISVLTDSLVNGCRLSWELTLGKPSCRLWCNPLHGNPVVITILLHVWKNSTWKFGSKYPDTSQLHSSIAPTLMSLEKIERVWNRVCIGLNFQPRNFYPISFLLNDLEHVLLGEEVFILSIYLNHLCWKKKKKKKNHHTLGACMLWWWVVWPHVWVSMHVMQMLSHIALRNWSWAKGKY